MPEEAQLQARQDAIDLLRTRLEQTKAKRPDYGDCEEYYNYGSISDRLLTHPVSLGLDQIFGEDSWYHKFFYETLAPDGMFSTINIGYYAADTIFGDKNSDIREDNPYDFLKVRSAKSIDKDVEEKMQIPEKLEESIDNPEVFSKLFYDITDGKNFDANEFKEYRTDLENGTPSEPLDVLLGRNYLEEDYALNRLGTNIAFSVNKSVGTNLMRMVPAGEAFAFGINMVLDVFNENTKDNPDLSVGNIGKMAVAEGLRSFPINIKGNHLLSAGAQKGAVMTNSIATKPIMNISSDSVREELEANNYAMGAVSYESSLSSPIGQTNLIFDGITTGSDISSDIDSGNIGIILYDSQQIIANPVAQTVLMTAGGWNSGQKVANGDNVNAVDVLQLVFNPVAQFTLLFSPNN